MHPIADKGPATVRAGTLRDFVLVMRKDEIETAGVDIEGLPQMGFAHRRALDVPARPPSAPRAIPAGKICIRRLPQHEIGRVTLVGRDVDPRACDHLFAAASRQHPVMGVGGDREQHMTLGHIGVPARDQPFDHRDHLRDMLGGTWLDIGRQIAQRRHVLVKGSRRSRGQGGDRLPILARRGVDSVVDIGDVAPVPQVITAVDFPQQPIEDVEHDKAARVADMRAVIDRRSADIEAHPLRIEGLEGFLPARQRVVEAQRHEEGLSDCTRLVDRTRLGAQQSGNARPSIPVAGRPRWRSADGAMSISEDRLLRVPGAKPPPDMNKNGRCSFLPRPPCMPNPVQSFGSSESRTMWLWPATPCGLARSSGLRVSAICIAEPLGKPAAGRSEPTKIRPTQSCPSRNRATSATSPPAGSAKYSNAAEPFGATTTSEEVGERLRPTSTRSASRSIVWSTVSMPWSEPTMSRMRSPAGSSIEIVSATRHTLASALAIAAR